MSLAQPEVYESQSLDPYLNLSYEDWSVGGSLYTAPLLDNPPSGSSARPRRISPSSSSTGIGRASSSVGIRSAGRVHSSGAADQTTPPRYLGRKRILHCLRSRTFRSSGGGVAVGRCIMYVWGAPRIERALMHGDRTWATPTFPS